MMCAFSCSFAGFVWRDQLLVLDSFLSDDGLLACVFEQARVTDNQQNDVTLSPGEREAILLLTFRPLLHLTRTN